MAHFLITDDAMHDILRHLKVCEKYFTAACKSVECQSASEPIDFDYADAEVHPHIYYRVRYHNKVAYITRVRHKTRDKLDSLGQPKHRYYSICCENFTPSSLTPYKTMPYLKTTDIVRNLFGLFTDFHSVKHAFCDVASEIFAIEQKDLF